MSTRSSIDTNVQIDGDGFNTMIKWTFVGRGGKKTDSFCSRKEADRSSGISDMRKKEERVHKSCFHIVLMWCCQTYPIFVHTRRWAKNRWCMKRSPTISIFQHWSHPQEYQNWRKLLTMDVVFGDQHSADDDAADDEDVATADDD